MAQALYERHAGTKAARPGLASWFACLKERPYLNAAMAVCALTASADGEVGFEERYAIDAAMRRNPWLARFDSGRAVDVLEDQLHHLGETPKGTRDSLLATIERAGRRPERAVALLRLAWDVIEADGRVRRAEIYEFEMLCELLGVEPGQVRASLLGV